ncbi:MAG: hypothetical protein K2X55_19425 [Burkholderiaceae bacterium]|nr:hypothetical protein [Burkholderiaceae bacterium]
MDSLQYAKASAASFISASENEPQERNAIFASAAGGTITRNVGDGITRSITFKFDQSAAKLSEGIGVSFEEARAKTDWKAYSKIINAAFETEGVTSLRFVGLWRPTYQLFNSYFANSHDEKFDGKTAQQRSNMAAAVRASAHIGATWSPQHTKGNAIDIDQLNGSSINNDATIKGAGWNRQESAVIGAFTEKLWGQHPSSLLAPWRMYKGGTPPYIANSTADGDPWNHRHHIHFGL